MINSGISQIRRFPYWCHTCKKETYPTETEQGEPACSFCKNTFIEEIESFREDFPQIKSEYIPLRG